MTLERISELAAAALMQMQRAQEIVDDMRMCVGRIEATLVGADGVATAAARLKADLACLDQRLDRLEAGVGRIERRIGIAES
jgi:ubiquinone biosynthesis protein UbiJ